MTIYTTGEVDAQALAMLLKERDELRDALKEHASEIERLTSEAMFQQQMTEPDDIMFERIERAARASFRRHRSSTRGQQLTRADAYQSHLVWAAQAEMKPKLAAQRKVLEQALEALNVMQEDVVSTPNAYEAQRQAVRAIQEVLHE